MNNEIKIGLGLGKVTFGSSKESIKKNLGEPNEIEVLDIPIDGEEVTLEQWHYDDLELSASFDIEQDEILETLAVSSDEYTINGVSLIGKKINAQKSKFIALTLKLKLKAAELKDKVEFF